MHIHIIDTCSSFRHVLSVISTPKYWLINFVAPVLLPLTVNEFTDHESTLFTDDLTLLLLILTLNASCQPLTEKIYSLTSHWIKPAYDSFFTFDK